MSKNYKRNALRSVVISVTLYNSRTISTIAHKGWLCVQRKTSLLLVPNLILPASLRTSAHRGMKDVPEFT